MDFALNDVLRWEDKYRIRFINSISGYKSVHLVGTQDDKGVTNLAIFNSIVHIGASPPLVGFVMRPLTVERHTYRNIMASGCYTINHVHKSFLKQAHYTSAKFPTGESEFNACHLTQERHGQFLAPFVKESKIKFGLKLKEDLTIKENGTHFIIGEIQHIRIDEALIEPDGQLDLALAHDVCVTGLNQYSSVSKFTKLPSAKVSETSDFGQKERADNVVFDKNSQHYNSSLLPYGTNIGAPKIEATGVSTWKNSSINSFNHTFQNKIDRLKDSYQQLINEYEINQMVYGAKMNFEPIVGQVHHLYYDDNKDQKFLSLIPPTSWNRQHAGSFKLTHEKLWERVE